jgi:hypothetical protein
LFLCDVITTSLQLQSFAVVIISRLVGGVEKNLIEISG